MEKAKDNARMHQILVSRDRSLVVFRTGGRGDGRVERIDNVVSSIVILSFLIPLLGIIVAILHTFLILTIIGLSSHMNINFLVDFLIHSDLSLSAECDTTTIGIVAIGRILLAVRTHLIPGLARLRPRGVGDLLLLLQGGVLQIRGCGFNLAISLGIRLGISLVATVYALWSCCARCFGCFLGF